MNLMPCMRQQSIKNQETEKTADDENNSNTNFLETIEEVNSAVKN
jgi:hypothetical protein